MSPIDSEVPDPGTPETDAAGTTAEKAGHSLLREWADNGVLIREAAVDDGRFHGQYATWWENGERREEGRFYRGVRVGLYRWFSENGTLLKEEDYGPGVH